MVIAFFFWISIPLSLVASVYGVWKNIYWLVLLGAFFFIPTAYYLNGSPPSNGLPLLLPFFQVGSAVAVFNGKKVLAWLFLMPAFLIVIWFFVVLFSYYTA